MLRRVHLGLLFVLLACQPAAAQEVIEGHEILSRERPEAWAMNYMAASTLMTSFGQDQRLVPGQWQLALDLGHIPHLSTEQTQVGFNGFKNEDLNKSPVFGRLRMAVGLPAGVVVELGYTPPVEINGARTRDLFALALGRRLVSREKWTLSARLFGQVGSVGGDITCPEHLAGIEDPDENPYGCQAPSTDRLELNYYGGDLTMRAGRGRWHWHADLGLARTELAVQVDALTYDFRDRTRLSTTGVQRFLALGVGRAIGSRWNLAAEVLHVPLPVRRDPDSPTGNDPFTGLRLQLRYVDPAGG